MGTSFLSMMEARMPPGFRFHPRDEELINDYLAKKLSGDSVSCPMMVDVDLNKVEPWDLPGEACVGEKEWYFYSLRDRKYATGLRTNRATLSGYWKATGKDRPVHDAKKGGRLVGMRKTLVFYQGRAPKGKKTDWVMHEFRLESSSSSSSPSPANGLTTGGDGNHRRSSISTASKEDWVLCRVFYKSRGLSLKPNVHVLPSATSENCYDDDTGSSSLPPLMDSSSTAAFISFDQQPNHSHSHGHSHSHIHSHGTTLQGLLYSSGTTHEQQVPCFSSSSHLPLPPFRHRQLPLDTSSIMLPIRQLVTLPDLNPLMGGFPSICDHHEKKANGTTSTTVLAHHLSKMEEEEGEEPGSQKPAPPQEGSSDQSFLTEAGPPGHPTIWTPY